METLDRHDRWLCMMYPRLALLRQFLREDGAIFVSLDDNEIQALRYVMDEIFGEHNFVTSVIWEKNYAPKASAKYLSENHDYVVLYAKNKAQWQRNLIPRSEKQDKQDAKKELLDVLPEASEVFMTPKRRNLFHELFRWLPV